jgi:hypothetical protein
MASTTAYSRPSKPPGPSAGGDRRAPRLAKELGRIEPKKLGIGLVAGCCLALLTYLSFARLFAIYSPVFGKEDEFVCRLTSFDRVLALFVWLVRIAVVMSESSSLVMKNAPPATTTTAPVEPLPHKNKDGVQKDARGEEDRTDPEADPTIPNLPEQEEATKKPCEHSFRFFFPDFPPTNGT